MTLRPDENGWRHSVLLRKAEDHFAIFINKSETPERSRFLIAASLVILQQDHERMETHVIRRNLDQEIFKGLAEDTWMTAAGFLLNDDDVETCIQKRLMKIDELIVETKLPALLLRKRLYDIEAYKHLRTVSYVGYPSGEQT